ncbi:hypothetical protein SAMN05216499_11158 [Actinacidiphila paucisporea]|uniref:Uncharacterized protein n=1 Tax=Actinacidiphila paucisporea TaxID=310782 RepID=A0A1M7IWU3_9ACTN|nr:hypothetical protein SAMN05216499_11158 [Actinacidiphila paucisporea]
MIVTRHPIDSGSPDWMRFHLPHLYPGELSVLTYRGSIAHTSAYRR